MTHRLFRSAERRFCKSHDLVEPLLQGHPPGSQRSSAQNCGGLEKKAWPSTKETGLHVVLGSHCHDVVSGFLRANMGEISTGNPASKTKNEVTLPLRAPDEANMDYYANLVHRTPDKFLICQGRSIATLPCFLLLRHVARFETICLKMGYGNLDVSNLSAEFFPSPLSTSPHSPITHALDGLLGKHRCP